MGNEITSYPIELSYVIYLLNFVLTLKLQVPLEDPKRYRVELTYSRGADLSPLEVIQSNPIHVNSITLLEEYYMSEDANLTWRTCVFNSS